MAALWEEYSWTHSLSTVASVTATELFHNEVDDHIFASAPITIVDGVVTMFTNGDDLFLTSLVVCNEQLVSAEVSAIPRHSPEVYYSMYNIGGPLVFRLRSKKTIPPEHKLWVRSIKAQGADAEDSRGGVQLLMVRHQ